MTTTREYQGQKNEVAESIFHLKSSIMKNFIRIPK